MVKLISPIDGETVSLTTQYQKDFLKADRSGGEGEDIDWLHLEFHHTADESLPLPVVFRWEGEREAVLEISRTPDFSRPLTYRACGSAEVYNLMADTQYFWRVEDSPIFTFITAKEFPCRKYIEGTTNVRDCADADGKIRQGLLFRGAELNSHVNATQKGLESLEKELRIKTVLDIRGQNEELLNPYGKRYINIPVAAYGDFIYDRKSCRQIFSVLAHRDNYPIYFHCWGGADRTGTIAFLVGALMGVSEQYLVDDYEMTSLSVWGIRSRNTELFKSLVSALFDYSGSSLRIKVTNYLLDCGVTAEELESIKNILSGR